MPGGALVEVVIVLLFVFVTMSAIVSSAQELFFQITGWRSRNLRRTVERMLSDGEYKNEVCRRVYNHPLIAGASGGKKQVTWIEPSAFALAVAHAIQPAGATSVPMEDIPNSVDALRDSDLKRRLQQILPPPAANASRSDMQVALTEWFNAASRKASETYRSDATAASYVIAAIATVLLNVSPIEITQRLMADDALRTTFASAVPDLAPMLFNPGEGVSVSTPAGNNESFSAAPARPAVSAAGGDAPVEEAAAEELTADPSPSEPAAEPGNSVTLARLSRQELEQMLTLYKCAESRLSLPIGWEWMANAAGALNARNSEGDMRIAGGGESQACTDAVAEADSPALKTSLARLSLTTKTNFSREYGPNFETDHPALIFAGWLIMMIAAAQGAPFWFDLLKKFIRT